MYYSGGGGSCPTTCLFCGRNETINHLFLECPLARYIWGIISCATGFQCQFASVDACLVDWLKGFPIKKRRLISVGVSAVFWAIWKARNSACFEKKWPLEPIDVIYRIVYWIDFWSGLQVTEDAKLELQRGARLLGRIAEEVFAAKGSWRSWIPRLEN